MTSFDEVVIMLHKFDSNSEHTFFTLQLIFGFLLKIVSCDKRLILKEHHTSGHLYADNVQAFVHGPPSDQIALTGRIDALSRFASQDVFQSAIAESKQDAFYLVRHSPATFEA